MPVVAMTAVMVVVAEMLVWDTIHFDISPLKELVIPNIPLMSVTLDASHFEISPLKTESSRMRSLTWK